MIPRLEHSLYHKTLRVLACVFACVLVFNSGMFSTTTALLSRNTGHYVANVVGVNVGVAPTEINTLTAKITTLEQERDLALREREIAIGLNGQTSRSDTSTFILSSILFILVVLIVLNYALDFMRARERLLANENKTRHLA